AGSQTMTQKSAALQLLLSHEGPAAIEADLAYRAWRATPALDHWFSAHAASTRADTAESVRALMGHGDFSWDNNGRLKAIFDAFLPNQNAYHAAAGSGYALVKDAVLALDLCQPRLAARFVRPFAHWRRFDKARQILMRSAIDEIGARA